MLVLATAVAAFRFALAPHVQLAYAATASLDGAHPGITRTVVVLHGNLRNADEYEKGAEAALAAAHGSAARTLIVAPQFLDPSDLGPNDGDLLRWKESGWQAGEDALAPQPISSYTALDRILERLADRSAFPNLRTIVVAGHSGGGQVADRYAVVGRAPDTVLRDGLAVRFVIANPSSYVYFDRFRPAPIAPDCAFNHWKFGFDAPPRYVDGSVSAYEAAFVKRDVYFAAGLLDNDPNGEAIDKGCAAEAQGPTRLQRARNYVAYLNARDNNAFAKRFIEVPGVGHSASAMFASPQLGPVIFGDGT